MPTAATVLVSKIEQFAKDIQPLVAQLYTERATPEELVTVMAAFSKSGQVVVGECDKIGLLYDTARTFAPPKPVVLPKFQWTFEHGECKAKHVIFGNTEEEWLKFAESWEAKHGEWPEVTERKEIDTTARFTMIYGIQGMPTFLKFQFDGTVEEYVRHAGKVGAVLLDTQLVELKQVA